jgi:hypothetical protein
MKLRVIALMLLAILLSCESAQNAHDAHAAISSVLFCDAFKSPDTYVGKQIRFRARITATKEGTFLWDPQCRNTFALLHYKNETQNTTSMSNLSGFLMRYGLSDHPIIATLTGSVKKQRCADSLWRTCLVFVTHEASAVTLSGNIEHP